MAIPSNLPTHATLFRQGKGGQDLPRFSTTSTFSPNEDAEQGQAVIFVSNSIFSIFGSPQWFIDQRGGVFFLLLGFDCNIRRHTMQTCSR